MNSLEIQGLENQLGFPLPAGFLEMLSKLREPPYSEFGDEYYGLWTDAESLWTLNSSLRKDGFDGEAWPNEFFCFASDSMGSYYYVDIRLENSPVFVTDHEAPTQIDTDSFSDWLEVHYQDVKDTERQREEKGPKRWWEFWRS